MGIYLLKSSIILGLFLVVYVLFFEKERMHRFKRCYLIISLFAAFGVPLCTITEMAPLTSEMMNISVLDTSGQEVLSTASETSPLSFSLFLWSIYLAGFLVMAYRFLKNIIALSYRAHCNLKINAPYSIRILHEDSLPPHSFFQYLFLNKSEYQAEEISPAVILHEEAHVKQWHSLDIILVELLHVLFWFNPLLHFAKKAIRLNHEFLADEEVLNAGMQKRDYQHMLLNMTSSNSPLALASSINYPSIKKRLIAMNTENRKWQNRIKGFLLLPLCCLVVLGFSERDIKYVEPAKSAFTGMSLQQDTIPTKATNKEVEKYNRLARKYNMQKRSFMRIDRQDVEELARIHNIMTAEQKQAAESYPSFPEPPNPPPAPPAPPSPPSAPPPPPAPPAPMNDSIPVPPIPPLPSAPSAPPMPPVPPVPEFEGSHSVNIYKEAEHLEHESRQLEHESKHLEHQVIQLEFQLKSIESKNFMLYNQIAAQRALGLLKKHPNMNISTTKINSGRPTVKLSREKQ